MMLTSEWKATKERHQQLRQRLHPNQTDKESRAQGDKKQQDTFKDSRRNEEVSVLFVFKILHQLPGSPGEIVKSNSRRT